MGIRGMTRKPEFKILPMSEEHIREVARLEIECFSVPGAAHAA